MRIVNNRSPQFYILTYILKASIEMQVSQNFYPTVKSILMIKMFIGTIFNI